MRTSASRIAVFFLSVLIAPLTGWAAGPPKPSSINDPVVLTMVIIMFILLLAIALLANILIGAANYKREEEKKQSTGGIVSALLLAVLLPVASTAQDTVPVVTTAQQFPGGLSATAFYFMTGVLIVELLVIFILLFQVKQVLRPELPETEAVEKEPFTVRWKAAFATWWKKMNSFKPIEQEADIELDHDYDGIKELDNRLPPWWLYGFYLTIIIGVVYLWRYHVAESAPLSAEELQIEMARAEKQKAEYLKNAANNVDENTVVLLSAESDIAAGKKLYSINCAACHGQAGEGTVGPNLTDEYWMHGGSLSDVFKSIKYGWPDKGMKSWKDDFSPMQIAQLTSFLKKLEGTNPPNAKEPQGDIYKEQAAENEVTMSTDKP